MSTQKTKTQKRIQVVKSVWMLLGFSFIVWLFYSVQAKDVSEDLLSDNEVLEFRQTPDYYVYTPRNEFKEVLIFYPGALVQPMAYLPLLHRVASEGIQVWVVRMPFRMSNLGYKKSIDLGLLSDSSKTITLAGHSQGAKMAAQFVYEYPDMVDRLILIATTHPRDISLATISHPVLKIFGTNDGVASEWDITENAPLLPQHTRFFKIEGGNHAQFGHYGPQLGDGKATISRELQQVQTAQEMIRFILSGTSIQK